REVHAPSGIVEHVAAEMTVRVRAGITVVELDDALAASGQCVALPSWSGASVGGVVAVGHSGLRRLGWGPVRDTVLEVRYVSAEGRAVTPGRNGRGRSGHVAAVAAAPLVAAALGTGGAAE